MCHSIAALFQQPIFLSLEKKSYKKGSFGKNIDISWSRYIYYWRTKIKLLSHAQILTLCVSKSYKLVFLLRRSNDIETSELKTCFLQSVDNLMLLLFIVTFPKISNTKVSDQKPIPNFYPKKKRKFEQQLVVWKDGFGGIS